MIWAFQAVSQPLPRSLLIAPYARSNLCRYIFVEYGPMELDLNLRVRIHELEEWLKQKVRPCHHEHQ